MEAGRGGRGAAGGDEAVLNEEGAALEEVCEEGDKEVGRYKEEEDVVGELPAGGGEAGKAPVEEGDGEVDQGNGNPEDDLADGCPLGSEGLGVSYCRRGGVEFGTRGEEWVGTYSEEPVELVVCCVVEVFARTSLGCHAYRTSKPRHGAAGGWYNHDIVVTPAEISAKESKSDSSACNKHYQCDGDAQRRDHPRPLRGVMFVEGAMHGLWKSMTRIEGLVWDSYQTSEASDYIVIVLGVWGVADEG